MAWDPNEHDPKEQRPKDRRKVPPGDYLVGIAGWKRYSPKSVRLVLRVLAGQLKGAACFPSIATNVEEKQGSANRMYWVVRAFDIQGELDFGERCFNEQFLGRAGKVRIHSRKRGEYTNYDIDMCHDRDDLSTSEVETLEAWQIAYAAHQERRTAAREEEAAKRREDGFDAPDPGDGDFPGGDFGDDDIPF